MRRQHVGADGDLGAGLSSIRCLRLPAGRGTRWEQEQLCRNPHTGWLCPYTFLLVPEDSLAPSLFLPPGTADLHTPRGARPWLPHAVVSQWGDAPLSPFEKSQEFSSIPADSRAKKGALEYFLPTHERERA